MITLKNTQRTVKVNTEQLKKDAALILDTLGYHDFDLGILLTSNKTMYVYNRDYRNQDKATDILSFPYHTDIKAGERIEPETEEDKNLGDLIIAPQYVMDDLPRWEQSFEERMRVLLAHGICHLLGYDHIEDEDYKIMHAQETLLLKKLAESDLKTQ
jgi:probable rRNA maturation factor